MVSGWINALARIAMVWIPAWTVICCGCIPAMDASQPEWTGARLVLWLAALTTCVWEIRRMNKRFIKQGMALDAADLPRPNRLDHPVSRPTTLILLGLVMSAILCTRWVIMPGFFNPFEWVALTMLAACIITLAAGSWSSLWYRLATRRLSVAGFPKSAPMLVAVSMSLVMVVLLWRIPRAGAVRLATVTATSTLMAANDEDPSETVELLVELGPDDSITELQPILRRYGARATRAVPSAPPGSDMAQTYIVSVMGGSAFILMIELGIDSENVDDITINELLPASATPPAGQCIAQGTPLTNDPLSAAQAPLASIGAASLLGRPPWGVSRQPPVQIHMLDDGVQRRHEDLQGVLVGASGTPGPHGTAVAGIIGARTHNGTGIASLNGTVAPFALTDYDVVDDSPTIDDVAEALVNAGNNRAAVVVMAMEARGTAPKLVRDAAVYAQSRGAVLVAAAGNHGGSSVSVWPANLPGVLVATALDGADRASFSASSRSRYAVSAPGVGICAPSADGGYQSVSGTSMSAAFVGSAVAVYAARCPDTTAEQRISAVVGTARPVAYGTVEPVIDVSALAGARCPP